MKKKVLKVAGVFCLFTVLCINIVGCSGKENKQPDLSDIHMTNESDSNKDIETGGEYSGNGTEGNSEGSATNNEENSNEVENGSKVGAENEKGTFYDGANLSGRVVEFSETGFTITPRTLIINEDDSMEGGIAAPGYESDETNINITYAEDVVFQIINFSMSSQAETSREDTDKSSVKKDTDVNIFGTCQDEKHWIADKVVVTRWQ